MYVESGRQGTQVTLNNKKVRCTLVNTAKNILDTNFSYFVHRHFRVQGAFVQNMKVLCYRVMSLVSLGFWGLNISNKISIEYNWLPFCSIYFLIQYNCNIFTLCDSFNVSWILPQLLSFETTIQWWIYI